MTARSRGKKASKVRFCCMMEGSVKNSHWAGTCAWISSAVGYYELMFSKLHSGCQLAALRVTYRRKRMRWDAELPRVDFITPSSWTAGSQLDWASPQSSAARGRCGLCLLQQGIAFFLILAAGSGAIIWFGKHSSKESQLFSFGEYWCYRTRKWIAFGDSCFGRRRDCFGGVACFLALVFCFWLKRTANDLFGFVHNNRRALYAGKLSRMVDVEWYILVVSYCFESKHITPPCLSAASVEKARSAFTSLLHSSVCILDIL